MNSLRIKFVSLVLLPLGLTTALFADANQPTHKKEREEAEQVTPWVTPNTPPTIEPGTGVTVSCPDPLPEWKGQWVKLDHTKESFYIYIPKDFDPKETYGVMVFIIGERDSYKMESEWRPVLDQRKLIYIAPQNAGNKQVLGRRVSLALASVSLIKKYYKIDPKRIYISGHSGGARTAGIGALNFPDLFTGTIQGCGADFYEPVPRVAVTDQQMEKGGDYGGCQKGRASEAQKNVRFVFITGPRDQRHNYILDIYNGGYKAKGFDSMLIDVPTMGHQPYNAESMGKALDFIEKKQ